MPVVVKDVVKPDIVVNTVVKPVVKESRQVEWQRANRERYNAKMRKYMRGRPRAKTG